MDLDTRSEILSIETAVERRERYLQQALAAEAMAAHANLATIRERHLHCARTWRNWAEELAGDS
jgi:hypothetical protein